MRVFELKYVAGMILSLAIAVFYIITIDNTSIPWMDEIGTSDVAVNVVTSGKWYSHVWPYSYNPLHAFLLIGWLKVFGVSHMTVCSLSVIFALVIFIVLFSILIERKVVSSVAISIIFTLLFWGGYQMSSMVTEGRIDMLVMLWTVLLVNEMIPGADHKLYYVFVYAFLLMLSSVYSIPLIILFWGYLCLLYEKDRKQLLFKKGILMMPGFLISFVFVCLFFWADHSLIRFLHSFIRSGTSGNVSIGFLYHLKVAYLREPVALALILISFVLMILKGKRMGLYGWCYFCFVIAIPLLMVMIGRYARYYSWLFYIPSLIIFTYVMKCEYRKMAKGFAMMFAVLVFSNSIYMKVLSSDRIEDKNVEIIRTMSAFKSYLNVEDNVVFTDPALYYHLVNLGVCRWYKYEGMLIEKDTPQKQVADFCTKMGRWSNDVKKIISAIEVFEAYLPQEGYVITDNGDNCQKAINYLLDNHATFSVKCSKNNRALVYFRFDS